MSDLVFNALVIETTDRCNAQCAMCYQAAGPKGSALRGDNHLALDVVERVIDEAAELPELRGDRVHVAGGESFLNWNEMLALFTRAKLRGFGNIGATTNAFWARSEEIADRKCAQLGEAGVTYLEVSTDYWHLPYVSTKPVRHLLHAMRRTGLRVMLRTLSSKSHAMLEVLDAFDAADLLQSAVVNGRVQPLGRAAEQVPMSDVYLDGNGVTGSCELQLNLTVTPNGNVYPCCAGADMTESLSSGNVTTEPLADVVLKMRTEAVIREVIHNGSGSLLPVIEQLGFGDRLLPEYASICHLCWDVFRQEDLAEALRRHYQDQMLERLLAQVSCGAPAGGPTERVRDSV